MKTAYETEESIAAKQESLDECCQGCCLELAPQVESPLSTRTRSTSGCRLPKSVFQSKALTIDAVQRSFESRVELSLVSPLVGQGEKFRNVQAGASIAKCLNGYSWIHRSVRMRTSASAVRSEVDNAVPWSGNPPFQSGLAQTMLFGLPFDLTDKS